MIVQVATLLKPRPSATAGSWEQGWDACHTWLTCVTSAYVGQLLYAMEPHMHVSDEASYCSNVMGVSTEDTPKIIILVINLLT